MTAKVITVAQQKGGAGKTTLVAHLGLAFAAEGKRVALVDVDPQRSLAEWARVRAEHPTPLRYTIDVGEVAGWKLSSALGALKRNHDIVIVDSPPHAETDAKAAIRAADIALVPVQPSPMDVWATKPTVELARAAKVPVFVVLNRAPPRSRVATIMRADLDDAGLPVAMNAIGNRVAFAASMLEGRTVIETARTSAGADEVRALKDEIAKRL